MIRLDGCRAAPLSSYMAGMGVFRIVAEQNDPGVQAFWENDRLVLETGRGREDLVDFLLHGYEPSPVIGPWSYDTYVKGVDHGGPVMGMPRMRRYRAAVESTKHVLRTFRDHEGLDRDIAKKDIAGEAKLRFLRMCRNMWPDDAVEWLDATAALMPDRPAFNPVFGTGGNDGRFDMTWNFILRLRMVFADREDMSRKWLEAAMFGKDAALAGLKTFGHDPRGSGRPNSGSEPEGSDISNPWEYILMVEGMLMFAGGISRRVGQRSGRSAFPFVSESTKAGYGTAADEEDRGEIWAPLWGRPASYHETRLVLREGRASYGGRNARTGADFALAATSLGVERGIDGFRRYGVLERKGRSYLSVDAGRLSVGDVPEAGLVRDIMPWYRGLLRFAQGSKAPQSLRAAVRQFEGDLVGMCRDPGPPAAQSFLAALGRLERIISGRTWSDKSGVRPFSGTLQPGWLAAANDGTAEFRLAAAAASVRGLGGVGPIRENLERVELDDGRWAAAPRSASCVWHDGAALADNLGRIFVRRVMEGRAAKSDVVPLGGCVAASLGDMEGFLAGVLNEQKIEDLLLPLSMVRADDGEYAGVGTENRMLVPSTYALVKSVYNTPGVPADLAPLRLLGAGRTADALDTVRRRAKASGMLDGTGAVVGEPPACVAERLLGSLVFPVGPADRKRLLDAAALREPPNV